MHIKTNYTSTLWCARRKLRPVLVFLFLFFFVFLSAMSRLVKRDGLDIKTKSKDSRKFANYLPK